MNTGPTIGHYTILRPLCKGGMGEVYLAEDTRLIREVAIKILPESASKDPDRLKRFRREAEAAAKLKHPNNATVHALEEFDGVLFIVMEYVKGQTLSRAIPSNGMALERLDAMGRPQGIAPTFYDVYIPLADALAHGHRYGRVHRGLKPTNIMVTEEGTPKILDFGLAPVEREKMEAVDSEVPTATMKAEHIPDRLPSLTQGKGLMGTSSYMSPEQTEGKTVDARTDLFSFGIGCTRPYQGNGALKVMIVENWVREFEDQP